MVYMVVGLVIASMFPWVLAAASAFLIEAGSDTANADGQPVAASYQPMRILTSRAPESVPAGVHA